MLAAACGPAAATSDPLAGILPPEDSGVGAALRVERSPYRGSNRESDLLPLFFHERRHYYLSSYRAGLKLERPGWRTELFLKRRFEGFASNNVPTSLAGTGKRALGTDVGIAAQLALGSGTLYGELMTDGGDVSEGSELRLGYRYEGWWQGRLRLRPFVTFAFRDAHLNNYYYGVRPEEATAERPAYQPGAGVNTELGVLAAYRLTAGWQLFGQLGVVRTSSGVRASPVVDDRVSPNATLGLLYGFQPQELPRDERNPVIVRVLHGASSDCDLLPIVSLRCTTVHTQDKTSVAAVELGERLVERLNGWPIDIAGFVGLLRHEERGLQPDFWQLNGYLKAYYDGFPWSGSVRTRLGLGLGVAYASRVPFAEIRDQALRGRDTSKLLLYADPTLDLSLGDLLGMRELRHTFVGVGVSHRSGIFGWARLFNNVSGGSNYIYGYVEWTL